MSSYRCRGTKRAWPIAQSTEGDTKFNSALQLQHKSCVIAHSITTHVRRWACCKTVPLSSELVASFPHTVPHHFRIRKLPCHLTVAPPRLACSQACTMCTALPGSSSRVRRVRIRTRIHASVLPSPVVYKPHAHIRTSTHIPVHTYRCTNGGRGGRMGGLLLLRNGSHSNKERETCSYDLRGDSARHSDGNEFDCNAYVFAEKPE